MTDEVPVENSERLWLVKSSGRLQGPFSTKQIIDGIRTRKIHIMDQICAPTGRWRCVREEKAFVEVVTDILTKENTVAINKNGTTLDEIIDDDKTPSPVEAKLIQAEIKRLAEKREHSSKYVLKFAFWALLFVAGMSAAILHVRNLGGGDRKITNAERKASAALDKGDYLQAEKILEDALINHPKNANIKISLASILIGIDNQTVKGVRLLEDVLSSQPTDEMWVKAHNLLGLAELRDGKMNRAEIHFQQSLDKDKNFVPALTNFGILNMLRNNYSAALDYFGQAAKQDKDDALSVLLRALSILAQEGRSGSGRQEAIDALTQIINVSNDYLQEAYLLRLYAHYLDGKRDKAEEDLNSMMAVYPLLTQNHLHDVVVHHDVMNWNRLLPLCDEVAAARIGNSTALRAYCSMRAGELATSEKLIKDAIAKAPSHNMTMLVQTLYLQNMDRQEEANLVIDKMLAADSSDVAKLLKAESCYSKSNYACAESYWQQVNAKNPRNLVALEGLARLAYDQGNTKLAKKLVDDATAVSRNYRPVLELAFKLEKND